MPFVSRHELAVRASLARPYSGAVISEKLFKTNYLQKSRIVLFLIPLLDERRCRRARRKRPHSPRMGKTERKHQKAGIVRHSRHEGLAPLRCPKARNRFGLFCGRILAGHRIDRPVFFRKVPVPSMTRGSVDPWGSLFALIRLRGRRVGQIRPSVRDLKNGASPSPRLRRQQELE